MSKAPFRADQVGSLLRPQKLADVRAQWKRGEIPEADFQQAADDAIRDAAKKQQEVGLKGITDGEMRRDYWHLDFMAKLGGVKLQINEGPKFSALEEQPPIATVPGKVQLNQPIFIEEFKFLKSVTKETAKYTIPAPAMLHLRGGRASINKEIYPELGAFWKDVGAAYAAEVKAFADAGCKYLQLDDVSFAYMCDDKVRAEARKHGDDPDALPRVYADALTAAVKDRPKDMCVTVHTCRGNFKNSWVAQGGYDAVAEAMFSSDVDGFFMEFDTERSGSFEPLRYLPRGKKAILGLVSSKSTELESKELIKRRIDEATKYVPLEDLCLSPQCGFASTHHGNDLSMDMQWRKLALCVEIAREVWGEV